MGKEEAEGRPKTEVGIWKKTEANVRQGLKRQLAACRNPDLFAGKSDCNELLCGITKPEAGKATTAESPAAGQL